MEREDPRLTKTIYLNVRVVDSQSIKVHRHSQTVHYLPSTIHQAGQKIALSNPFKTKKLFKF